MSSQNVLTKELKEACSVALEKLDCVPIFTTFSQSSEFKNSYWQKAPFYCEEHLDNLIQAFTMKDVEYAVETDFLEAGRGTFVEGSGGWNMAMVSQVILFELFDYYYYMILTSLLCYTQPKGSSFQEAKLKYQEVVTAMKAKSGKNAII